MNIGEFFFDFLSFSVGESQQVAEEIIGWDLQARDQNLPCWIGFHPRLQDRHGLIVLSNAVCPRVSHEPEAEGG